MFTRRLAPGTTPAAGRVRTFILHGEHWRFRPVSDATTSSMIAGPHPRSREPRAPAARPDSIAPTARWSFWSRRSRDPWY